MEGEGFAPQHAQARGAGIRFDRAAVHSNAFIRRRSGSALSGFVVHHANAAVRLQCSSEVSEKRDAIIDVDLVVHVDHENRVERANGASRAEQ